ncbi:hypothetical protein ACP70R_015242 [Stipagrostis hirtigluma subsp. patula]
MALRYLARRVGVPALRRASGSHVSPSAGSRPLTSSSSQGGHSKGAGAGGARNPVKDAEDIASLKAEFAAQREDIRKSIRDEKIHDRILMGSGAAGAGFSWLIISYMIGEEREMA